MYIIIAPMSNNSILEFLGQRIASPVIYSTPQEPSPADDQRRRWEGKRVGKGKSVVEREKGKHNDRKARRRRERGGVWMGNLMKKLWSENME